MCMLFLGDWYVPLGKYSLKKSTSIATCGISAQNSVAPIENRCGGYDGPNPRHRREGSWRPNSRPVVGGKPRGPAKQKKNDQKWITGLQGSTTGKKKNGFRKRAIWVIRILRTRLRRQNDPLNKTIIFACVEFCCGYFFGGFGTSLAGQLKQGYKMSRGILGRHKTSG